tara:strand:+ start:721 stop:1116 length:396 start_codon:yes stop_codon:yes gene_type:complete
METIEEILSNIKDNKTPTSHDSYYCLVNMINHLRKLERQVASYKEVSEKRMVEVEKLRKEVDRLLDSKQEVEIIAKKRNTELVQKDILVDEFYKKNEHYISQLNDKKKEIEKLNEIIEKKDVQLKHYMPKR